MATSDDSHVRAIGQSVQGWTSIVASAKACLLVEKAWITWLVQFRACRGLDVFIT